MNDRQPNRSIDERRSGVQADKRPVVPLVPHPPPPEGARERPADDALFESDDRARHKLLRRTEQTLIAGHAEALALDGECLRKHRRITALVAAGADPDTSTELRSLSTRLGEAQRELADLRAQLDGLRRRVDPDGRLF
jgi:hypothetical protein